MQVIQSYAWLVHMPQLEVSNVSLAPKEPTAQQMDCRVMFFAPMAHIQTQKVLEIVYLVMPALSVQVLEWNYLTNVQMEHTVTQLVPATVLRVPKVIGEPGWYCLLVLTTVCVPCCSTELAVLLLSSKSSIVPLDGWIDRAGYLSLFTFLHSSPIQLNCVKMYKL